MISDVSSAFEISEEMNTEMNTHIDPQPAHKLQETPTQWGTLVMRIHRGDLEHTGIAVKSQLFLLTSDEVAH